VKINTSLLNEALVLQEKLRVHGEIRSLIDSLRVVADYKTLLKSSHRLRDIKDDAEARGVLIDEDVSLLANVQLKRLVAERNLRFEVDNIDIGKCTAEQVGQLQQLCDVAKESDVAENYQVEAELLKDKMAKSIEAQLICKLFMEYPPRAEYREPCILDPKTKRPIDPVTRKPVDLKLLLAPKAKVSKKKKKEAKYMEPEWSNDLSELDRKIQTIEAILQQAEELKLHETFVKTSQEQIARMRKELKFRRACDVEAKIIADIKLALKKKKK